MEEQKIRKLAEEAIQDQDDLFLVDVKVKGNAGNQKVLVFIDGDEGVSIDQCGKISRQIGAEIEEEDFMPGKYTLEVSSPGLDFPIVLIRQYKKNVGRTLDVETDQGDRFEGKLIEVEDEVITIDRGNDNRSLNLKEIKQAKVKVSFK